jgi:hypothetical protein
VVALKVEDEVNSSNNGKHEDQNQVKDKEAYEILRHLFNNFDQRTDLSMELDELHDSPNQARNRNGVQVLESKV